MTAPFPTWRERVLAVTVGGGCALIGALAMVLAIVALIAAIRAVWP